MRNLTVKFLLPLPDRDGEEFHLTRQTADGGISYLQRWRVQACMQRWQHWHCASARSESGETGIRNVWGRVHGAFCDACGGVFGDYAVTRSYTSWHLQSGDGMIEFPLSITKCINDLSREKATRMHSAPVRASMRMPVPKRIIILRCQSNETR